MLAIAGGMALLLGVIGIYGVISYSVSQRTREIGIRMALGARAGGHRVFVGDGCGSRRSGSPAAWRRRWREAGVSSLLFDVAATDPLTYAAVSAGLAAAAALASYVPALRATAVNPVDALRAE